MIVIVMIVVCLRFLTSLSSDAAHQLNILGYDGNPLGVDSAEIGILKETHQVGLAGFLKSHDSRALELQVGFEVLCDLADESLEEQLPDEELCAFLVATDLTEGHSLRLMMMGLLDSSFLHLGFKPWDFFVFLSYGY